MLIVYGIQIAPKNDRYVAIAEESAKMVFESLIPGASLCNIFPVRKYECNRRFSMIYHSQTSIQSAAFQHGFLGQDSSGVHSIAGSSRPRCWTGPLNL